MKISVLCLSVLLGGCVAAKPKPDAPIVESDASQLPKGFSVDPSFPAGDAVMSVLRRHLSTQYIVLTRAQVTADESHDYVRFFAGWGIDHGFESVYWRYLIFVKKKNQSWSDSRVFDSGTLPMTPFEGPLELLEQKGRELGKPIQLPEPTSGLTPGRSSS